VTLVKAASPVVVASKLVDEFMSAMALRSPVTSSNTLLPVMPLPLTDTDSTFLTSTAPDGFVISIAASLLSCVSVTSPCVFVTVSLAEASMVPVCVRPTVLSVTRLP